MSFGTLGMIGLVVVVLVALGSLPFADYLRSRKGRSAVSNRLDRYRSCEVAAAEEEVGHYAPAAAPPKTSGTAWIMLLAVLVVLAIALIQWQLAEQELQDQIQKSLPTGPGGYR